MKESKRTATNQRPLLKRQEEITSWLVGRLEAIRQARKTRSVDLGIAQARVAAHAAQADGLAEKKGQCQDKIASLVEQITTCNLQIAALKKEIASVEEQQDRVSGHMAKAEQNVRRVRLHHVGVMRKLQDGKVRRKRRELAKVVRRLEAKERRRRESEELPRLAPHEFPFMTPKMKAEQMKKAEEEKKEATNG